MFRHSQFRGEREAYWVRQCSTHKSRPVQGPAPRDGPPQHPHAQGTPARGAGSEAKEVVVGVNQHSIPDTLASPAGTLAIGVSKGSAQQAPLAAVLKPTPPPTTRSSRPSIREHGSTRLRIREATVQVGPRICSEGVHPQRTPLCLARRAPPLLQT